MHNKNKKWLWAIPVAIVVVAAVVFGSTQMQKGALMMRPIPKINKPLNKPLVMPLPTGKPTFKSVEGLTTKLNNGLDTIAAVTVVGDPNWDVALKRIKFSFELYGNSDMDVSALDLIRKIGNKGEETITDQVSIRNQEGQNLKSGGSNLTTIGGQKWFTYAPIYITWNDQEIISKGTAITYLVRATVSNAGANESLSTYVGTDTNRKEIGLPAIDTADQLLTSGSFVIWSNMSALNHSLLSKDWENGYGLTGLPTKPFSLSF